MFDVDKLIKFISIQFKISEININNNVTISNLGFDSLDILEFIINLEIEYDISIKNEEINNIKSFNDIILLVEKKVKLSS